MFGSKLVSLVEGHTIEDAAADKKTAKRVGQFKVSAKAIYRADNKYLPFEAVTGYTCDKSSVHVTGCCAGCVPVERMVFETCNGDKIQFLFDSQKDLDKVIEILH